MKLKLSVTVIAILFAGIVAKSQVNVPDSLALVDLYNNTDGSGWYNHTNWLTKSPVSSWYGVSVNNGRINNLYLGGDNLSGTIPVLLGSLSSLRELDLSGNKITGNIPVTLGNLDTIKLLTLDHNNLTGSIPPFLDSNGRGYLKEIDLSYNNLTGNVPSWTNFNSLTEVNLSHNSLSGYIPSTLGEIQTLNWLDLSYNNISGSIPVTFNNNSNLSFLVLSHNQLSGAIPSYLSEIKNLIRLDLSYNQFSGDVSLALGSFKILSYLDISFNQLSGIIPNIIDTLIINNNNFTFRAIEALVKSSKGSSGWLTYAPQSNIHVSKQSGKLYVSPGGTLNNDTLRWYKIGVGLLATIVGDTTFVPVTAGNYMVSITNAVATQLTLSTDTISYILSSSIAIQDSLALVDFYNSTNGPSWTHNTNWLTSNPIKTWFGVSVGYDRVLQISLDYNSVSGVLPASLSHLTSLRDLELFQNNIAGNIPDSIGYLDSLTYLELNGNKFTGNIPSTLGIHHGLLQELDLGNNKLSGTIPTSLANFPYLSDLRLNNNLLSDSIPSILGNLAKLKYLLLSSNQLTGNIPSAIGNMSNLNTLDLSHNVLSGGIPQTFGNLASVVSLDLSFNKLSGEIPITIPTLLDSGLYIGNNQLTFWGLERLVIEDTTSDIYYHRTLSYSPQANIHIAISGAKLSVSAGGTPENNTYKWYKIGGGLVATNVADSTYTPNTPGSYTVVVTNKVATQLTLYSDTASIAALPITIVDFTGTLEKSNILLTWATATEINTSYFVIERCTDGVGYAPISSIKAVGNSTVLSHYTYIDNDVSLSQPLNYYYRLKEVDKNGQITYSRVIAVKTLGSSSIIVMYPNPVKNLLHVILNVSGRSTASIYSTDGKKLQQTTSTGNNGDIIDINTADLPAGVYIIGIDINGKHYEDKFVKG